MDIRSSSSLRRKNFKNKILLDPKLQETKNAITTLQSNLHCNTVTTIHVNPSIMNIQYQMQKEWKKKLTFIKQEVSNLIT
jgi:hypothetical protein